jgi:hypothetical protein
MNIKNVICICECLQVIKGPDTTEAIRQRDAIF